MSTLDLIPAALAALSILAFTIAAAIRAVDRLLARRRAAQATGRHDRLNLPAVWREAELAWLHAMWTGAEAAEPDPHKEH